VVMNSLLEYEGMGGQVQMIYIDPPYGVKFGSNFQPFIRKRDVKHNDDGDMTREPEMVQAYRDTWELGLHSYLTYLRDRLLVARDLLTASGSLFVQISDENLHHVRELLDDAFGAGNFIQVIPFYKTTSQTSRTLPQTKDYLVWYARDYDALRYRQLYLAKHLQEAVAVSYDWVELPNGTRRPLTKEQRRDPHEVVRSGNRIITLDNLTSTSGGESTQFKYQFRGQSYQPRSGGWKTNLNGMRNLEGAIDWK
jgi:adenine-specific DNA-methyltransferase